MHSQSALTKLQAILLIDVIVIAAAAGGFIYLQSLPAASLDQANIQLTDLTITPTQATAGQPITITFNVTNIGEGRGSYEANLMIDDVSEQTQNIQLLGGETKVVQFTIASSIEGPHTVKIGTKEGSFNIVSKFTLSDLAINRTQASIGEPVGISVKVTNRQAQTGDYSLTLMINGAVRETKTGQIEGDSTISVLFEVVEQAEGTYQVSIGNLNGTFQVLPAAPPARPAEFEVNNLIIDPQVTEANTPVQISVNVTNVGELAGSYSVELSVNGAATESKTVQLSGGQSTTVQFTVTQASTGTYSIKVGDLSGTFSIQGPSTIVLANMFVKPYEVWPGEAVTVTVKANNPGPEASSLSLRLVVDNSTIETKTVTLAAGASQDVTFTTSSNTEGAHNVAVNTLTYGGFKVVKEGFHTLSVSTSPATGVKFKLDGVERQTFYSELLPVGRSYTIEMPLTDPQGRYTFQQWDDGSTNPVKTVTLTTQLTVTASFTGGSSCPSLYVWNGTEYRFIGDVSNHGWLGYTRYVNSDGSLEYWRNNPWDYLPISSNQLQAINGNYAVNLTQRWDEIFFLDSAYMLVIDHQADQNVYSTMVEQYIDPNYMGQIYTVSKNPLKPVSATNELVTVYNGTVVSAYGQTDALAQISNPDSVFTTGFNGKYSEAWNNQTWNRLTLDLGNLAGAQQIKLIVNAIVDWGPEESYMLWMNKFYTTQVPDHTEPTPVPFMEVKDANGNWIRVPESRQFPLPPDGISRTFVVDLTGLFPTNDYSLRISNFWNVTFDYIGIDTTPQQNITIQRIDAQANLFQQFAPVSVGSLGNFTRYGDVTELLLSEDNKFVIGRRGDAVSLLFPAGNLAPPGEGMQRSYYFFVACWFKVQYANYGFGPGNDGFTVTPLPFHYMSGFPYPLQTESYPYDTDHLSYLQKYNTRVITEPTYPSETANSQVAQNGVPTSEHLLTLGTASLIAVTMATYKAKTARTHLRKR